MRASLAPYLLALCLMAAPAAADRPCPTEAEKRAIEARILQTEITVGALICGWNDRYASFVNRFEPVLAGHGAALRGYFRRQYGASATARLDDFVTALANDMQLYNATSGRKICASLDRRLRQLADLEPRDFDPYLASTSLPPLTRPGQADEACSAIW